MVLFRPAVSQPVGSQHGKSGLLVFRDMSCLSLLQIKYYFIHKGVLVLPYGTWSCNKA